MASLGLLPSRPCSRSQHRQFKAVRKTLSSSGSSPSSADLDDPMKTSFRVRLLHKCSHPMCGREGDWPPPRLWKGIANVMVLKQGDSTSAVARRATMLLWGSRSGGWQYSGVVMGAAKGSW